MPSAVERLQTIRTRLRSIDEKRSHCPLCHSTPFCRLQDRRGCSVNSCSQSFNSKCRCVVRCETRHEKEEHTCPTPRKKVTLLFQRLLSRQSMFGGRRQLTKSDGFDYWGTRVWTTSPTLYALCMDWESTEEDAGHSYYHVATDGACCPKLNGTERDGRFVRTLHGRSIFSEKALLFSMTNPLSQCERGTAVSTERANSPNKYDTKDAFGSSTAV